MRREEDSKRSDRQAEKEGEVEEVVRVEERKAETFVVFFSFFISFAFLSYSFTLSSSHKCVRYSI